MRRNVILLILAGLLAGYPVYLPGADGFAVQGRLTDKNGVNRDADDFTIKYSLYDKPSAGSLLWSKTIDSIHVNNGNFQVTLEDPGMYGQHTLLKDALAGDELYLEFQVLGGGNISTPEDPIRPRQRLVSVPFAMLAQEADGEVIPRGVVVAWSGALNADIFSKGWCLCDGRTYTAPDGAMLTAPDLSDRFVLGGSLPEIDAAGGSDNPIIDPPGAWTSNLSGWSFHSEPGLTKNFLGIIYNGAGVHRKHLLDIPPFQPGVQALYPKFYRLAFIMKL